MKPVIYYCYDAYCGWCYGFSPVVKRLAEEFKDVVSFDDIDAVDFYKKLQSEEYREKAHYEFALCRQLQVTAFPVLLLQAEQTKFYLVYRGYTHYDDVKARIDKILNEINGVN